MCATKKMKLMQYRGAQKQFFAKKLIFTRFNTILCKLNKKEHSAFHHQWTDCQNFFWKKYVHCTYFMIFILSDFGTTWKSDRWQWQVTWQITLHVTHMWEVTHYFLIFWLIFSQISDHVHIVRIKNFLNWLSIRV